MFQRRVTFIIFTLLLWFLAGNHCAFEILLDDLGLTPSEAHAIPRSNGDCPSHSESDTAKHKEGQLCGTKVLFEPRSQVLESEIVYVSFISNLTTLLSGSVGADDYSFRLPPTENFTPPRRFRLISAITANAPPANT